MIKQEVEDVEDDNALEEYEMRNETPPASIESRLSTDIAHESTTSGSAIHNKKYEQQYRKQQEEIASRLQMAVSEKFRLTKNQSFANGGDRLSCSLLGLNSGGNSSNSNRLSVRHFNNNKSSSSNLENLSRPPNKCTNDNLVANLIDNDDNNNLHNGGNQSNLDEDNGDSNYLLPCPLCEIPLEPRVFRQHLDRHYPRDSPICPVLQCGRRFAHPNSVRNHMRLKHTLQWAKMKAMRSSGGPFSGIPY